MPRRAPSISHLKTCLRRTLPDANIEVVSLPGLEQIRLGLINADYQTGPLSPEVMHAVIARPAYWAFCWGSGLSLARWLLANPEEVVDQTVLDFGPGSGIVAIAAAIAGAREVWACDNDADALQASAVNAQLNGVNLQLVSDLSTAPYADVLCMADVLYDKANFGLISLAKTRAKRVLIADSRITDIADSEFSLMYTDESLTVPNLGEFDEFRNVRLFAWDGRR